MVAEIRPDYLSNLSYLNPLWWGIQGVKAVSSTLGGTRKQKAEALTSFFPGAKLEVNGQSMNITEFTQKQITALEGQSQENFEYFNKSTIGIPGFDFDLSSIGKYAILGLLGIAGLIIVTRRK